MEIDPLLLSLQTFCCPCKSPSFVRKLIVCRIIRLSLRYEIRKALEIIVSRALGWSEILNLLVLVVILR